MLNVRSLRLSRGMTLVELALEAGIPARTLGAFEHGHACLDAESAARLADTLGVTPELLCSAHGHATERIASGRLIPLSWFRRAAPLLAGAVVSALLVTQAPLWQPLLVASVPARVARSAVTTAAPNAPPTATSAPERRRTPPTPPVAPLRNAFAALSAGLPPARTAAPLSAAPPPAIPVPLPAFRMEADGPHGCPLVTGGWIMITQGYGVGTHAPAEIWGALDLAIDGDSDGIPDPAATDGVPVVATHAGVARVYPMSWPGGNFVLVEDAQSGWSTAYAHLSVIAVADGQFVQAGTTLGNVGSTGQASGPHLHYEVRRGGVNLDPSGLVTCWG